LNLVPAAKAAAAFRVIIACGKFHGVINPATPMGCLVIIICFEEAGLGTISKITDKIFHENIFTTTAAGINYRHKFSSLPLQTTPQSYCHTQLRQVTR
jgi:hypothetical protein